MDVFFREVDPFNCWIWIHFLETPNQGERQYLEGVLDSWYVLGRMGAYNSGNLQANDQGVDLNWLNYDNDFANNSLPSLMHNLGQLEYKDQWARCWVDLGTCDPIAIDIFINILRQLDSNFVQIQETFIGGVNSDWPIEEHPDAVFNIN